MSRGVNKVILIGHVGKDPEVKYTPNGTAVANFTLATSETWKDKTSGEKQEKTEWHRLVAFARTAEIVGEYVKKGAKLFIEGRLQTRKWQDKDGHDRYTTEIIVNDLQMLDRKGDGGGEARTTQQAEEYAQKSGSSGAKKGGGKPAGAATEGAPFDDDIPF